EVGMGQNDGVDLFGRDGKILPIALAPFLLPLEEAAINQHLQAGVAIVLRVDEMFGSGNNSRSAEKLNIAQTCLTFLRQQTVLPFTGEVCKCSEQRNGSYCYDGGGTSYTLLPMFASGTLPSFTVILPGATGNSMRPLSFSPDFTNTRTTFSPEGVSTST